MLLGDEGGESGRAAEEPGEAEGRGPAPLPMIDDDGDDGAKGDGKEIQLGSVRRNLLTGITFIGPGPPRRLKSRALRLSPLKQTRAWDCRRIASGASQLRCEMDEDSSPPPCCSVGITATGTRSVGPWASGHAGALIASRPSPPTHGHLSAIPGTSLLQRTGLSSRDFSRRGGPGPNNVIPVNRGLRTLRP